MKNNNLFGNIQQMSYITLTYIGIKHVIYVVNEFIWKRIKWENVLEN